MGRRGLGVSVFVEGSKGEGSERVKIDSEDLAYLACSSGTTGLSKGVMLTHRNVVANLIQVASREGKMIR